MPYHHGDLARALETAAVRLIERASIDKVTMRAVAREAGVSHAAPAHHFATLNDLFAAMAATGFRELADWVAEAQAASGTDPWDRMRAFCGAYIRYAVENPGRFQVMFRRPDDREPSEFNQLKAKATAQLMEDLAARVEACLPVRAVNDPALTDRIAVVTWSLLHGCATLAQDGVLRQAVARRPGAVGADDNVVETFMGMLKAHIGRTVAPLHC